MRRLPLTKALLMCSVAVLTLAAPGESSALFLRLPGGGNVSGEGPENASGSAVAAGAHKYTFTLSSVYITKTRSRFKDTARVIAAVYVNGKEAGRRYFGMGEVGPGAHTPNVTVGPVSISDADQVTFAVNIENRSGFPDEKAYVDDGVRKFKAFLFGTPGAGQGAIGALAELWTDVAMLPVYLYSFGWGLAFPNCDGPVAAAVLKTTGAQLRARMKADCAGEAATWRVSVDSPGTKSASGCGGNSRYQEGFVIQQSDSRLPPVSCGGGTMCCTCDAAPMCLTRAKCNASCKR